jgi:hypothetical protein
MAFTFIVEDGTMVPGSNSYINVSDATDYIGMNIQASPSWVALDLLTQQNLLAWASRYLDQRATWYGMQTSRWLANPSYGNVIAQWALPPNPIAVPPQSMRWPRAGVRDIDENLIPYNSIPPALKDATAEMARYLIASDRSTERPQDFLTELKVDNVTLKFRDAFLAIVPSEVSYILRGLGTISNGKQNFSKITRA